MSPTRFRSCWRISPAAEVRLAESGGVVTRPMGWAINVVAIVYAVFICIILVMPPNELAGKTLLGLIATLRSVVFCPSQTPLSRTGMEPHRAARQRLTQDFNPALVEHFKNGWAYRSSLQILVEEIERALPGQLGGRFVVARRRVVVEAVIGAFVDVARCRSRGWPSAPPRRPAIRR